MRTDQSAAGLRAPDRRGSNAARRRRRAVLTIAARRPFSVEDIWREFLTDRLAALAQTDPEKAGKKAREKARLYLNGLQRAGRLVLLGEVQLNEWGGKRRKMFASPGLPVNRGWLMHDTMLWTWLDRLPNARVAAGYDDRLTLNQDARVTFSNGRIGHVEMDTESESLATVLKKFEENYRGKVRIADPGKAEVQNEFVLFVTLSESRIEKVRERLLEEQEIDGKTVKREALAYTLFAVWYDLVKGETWWRTCGASKVRLHQPGG